MRIMIKGGVWKNTEDEILKAAVMKYGLNQWARISSLLVRKSAKQCKARWYEWLDPSIKKTEWSQEEDEKLLHLAKIMPCQWRSIAPIVGRTAAQCLERYEHLLDSVSSMHYNEDNENDQHETDQELLHKSQLSSSNIRRLRPGEIDPNPECKPARPDAIDMDEDEKEMLSEARARLANTKGKKAKRKAREKQLEEARRLASLQKRRELKAAGIHLRKRRKKRYKYLDYNNEIPFYRKTPRGFWDTNKDDLSAKQITNRARTQFKPMFITDVEGERRDTIEERERKKDIQRQKLLKKINLPELVMRLNQSNANTQIIQRKRLDLPQPQISENELEDIAKLSKNNDGNNALSSTSVRTPAIGQIRTPSTHHKIVQQATNALRMQNATTPLLGGHNVSLYADDWNGVTPNRTSMSTPNINTPNALASVTSQSVGAMSDLSENKSKKRSKRKRKRLRSEFDNLPKPNYEYQVALPKLPDAPFQGDRLVFIEDAADRDERTILDEKRKEEDLWKKESLVIQHKLPRPKRVNPEMELNFMELDACDKSAQLQEASNVLRNEMMDLIFYDNNKYAKKKKKRVEREEFDDDVLMNAKRLLEKEMKHQNEFHQYDINEVNKELENEEEECLYVPHLNGYRFVGWRQFGDKLEAKKQEFNVLYQQIMKQKQKCDGMEGKLKIRMGGYDAIGQELWTKYVTARNKWCEMEDEYRIYQELKAKEERIIPQRIRKWNAWIEQEKERHNKLQNEYQRLKDEHDSLLC
eukprot:82020_1